MRYALGPTNLFTSVVKELILLKGKSLEDLMSLGIQPYAVKDFCDKGERPHIAILRKLREDGETLCLMWSCWAVLDAYANVHAAGRPTRLIYWRRFLGGNKVPPHVEGGAPFEECVVVHWFLESLEKFKSDPDAAEMYKLWSDFQDFIDATKKLEDSYSALNDPTIKGFHDRFRQLKPGFKSFLKDILGQALCVKSPTFWKLVLFFEEDYVDYHASEFEFTQNDDGTVRIYLKEHPSRECWRGPSSELIEFVLRNRLEFGQPYREEE